MLLISEEAATGDVPPLLDAISISILNINGVEIVTTLPASISNTEASTLYLMDMAAFLSCCVSVTVDGQTCRPSSFAILQ